MAKTTSRLSTLLKCAPFLGFLFLGTFAYGQIPFYAFGNWTGGPDAEPELATADSNGSNVTAIREEDFAIYEISYNQNNGKIYGANASSSGIFSINLDGSGYSTLVGGQALASGFALDLSGGKMYWTDTTLFTISRANIDGTGSETLISGLTGTPWALDVDTVNNKIYWLEAGNRLARSDLDGTNIETLVSGIGAGDYGVAVNPAAGKVYWTQSSQIRRANLDGTSNELFVSSPASGTLYVLEYDNSKGQDKLYWTDYGTTGYIRSVNSDGTGQAIDMSTTTITTISGVAIVPEPSTYALIVGALALAGAAFVRGYKKRKQSISAS